MFFGRVRMQVEVKVCRAYGARTMLGNSMPQPCRTGLTFGSRPYGPQSPDRFLEKHFQDEPAELQIPIRLRSGQALGCAPSKNISRKGPRNCRSLGLAR